MVLLNNGNYYKEITSMEDAGKEITNYCVLEPTSEFANLFYQEVISSMAATGKWQEWEIKNF